MGSIFGANTNETDTIQQAIDEKDWAQVEEHYRRSWSLDLTTILCQNMELSEPPFLKLYRIFGGRVYLLYRVLCEAIKASKDHVVERCIKYGCRMEQIWNHCGDASPSDVATVTIYSYEHGLATPTLTPIIANLWANIHMDNPATDAAIERLLPYFQITREKPQDPLPFHPELDVTHALANENDALLTHLFQHNSVAPKKMNKICSYLMERYNRLKKGAENEEMPERWSTFEEIEHDIQMYKEQEQKFVNLLLTILEGDQNSRKRQIVRCLLAYYATMEPYQQQLRPWLNKLRGQVVLLNAQHWDVETLMKWDELIGKQLQPVLSCQVTLPISIDQLYLYRVSDFNVIDYCLHHFEVVGQRDNLSPLAQNLLLEGDEALLLDCLGPGQLLNKEPRSPLVAFLHESALINRKTRALVLSHMKGRNAYEL